MILSNKLQDGTRLKFSYTKQTHPTLQYLLQEQNMANSQCIRSEYTSEKTNSVMYGIYMLPEIL